MDSPVYNEAIAHSNEIRRLLQRTTHFLDSINLKLDILESMIEYKRNARFKDIFTKKRTISFLLPEVRRCMSELTIDETVLYQIFRSDVVQDLLDNYNQMIIRYHSLVGVHKNIVHRLDITFQQKRSIKAKRRRIDYMNRFHKKLANAMRIDNTATFPMDIETVFENGWLNYVNPELVHLATSDWRVIRSDPDWWKEIQPRLIKGIKKLEPLKNHEDTVDDPITFTEYSYHETVFIHKVRRGKSHRVGMDQVTNWILTAIETATFHNDILNVTCPQLHKGHPCTQKINLVEFVNKLPNKFGDKARLKEVALNTYFRLEKEHFIECRAGIECPNPVCADVLHGFGIFIEDFPPRYLHNINNIYKCQNCEMVWCNQCGCQYDIGDDPLCHDDRLCTIMEALKVGSDPDEAFLQRNSRPCGACNVPTEHNGGCRHMTCSQCHSHWCWVCGFGDQNSTAHIIEEHLIEEHGGIFGPEDQDQDHEPPALEVINGQWHINLN